jgi:hypothetical protein
MNCALLWFWQDIGGEYPHPVVGLPPDAAKPKPLTGEQAAWNEDNAYILDDEKLCALSRICMGFEKSSKPGGSENDIVSIVLEDLRGLINMAFRYIRPDPQREMSRFLDLAGAKQWLDTHFGGAWAFRQVATASVRGTGSTPAKAEAALATLLGYSYEVQDQVQYCDTVRGWLGKNYPDCKCVKLGYPDAEMTYSASADVSGEGASAIEAAESLAGKLGWKRS